MYYQFRILMIVVSIGLLAGCKKESLQVFDPQPQYQLPQGNHPYDQRIIDFYNKYGTYILYRFNDVDFRWNYSRKLFFVAQPADPAYVEKTLNFLDKELFGYYKPEQLKAWMPYKILLCKEIHALDPSDYTKEMPLPEFVDAEWALSHIAFGHADARWDKYTVAEKKTARGNLHAVFLASAVARKKIEITVDFSKGVNYIAVNSSNYKALGIFDPYHQSLQEDIRDYVSRIAGHTKAELETLYFNPEFDPTGIYREKYEALISFFKANYNIDLQALGEEGLH